MALLDTPCLLFLGAQEYSTLRPRVRVSAEYPLPPKAERDAVHLKPYMRICLAPQQGVVGQDNLKSVGGVLRDAEINSNSPNLNEKELALYRVERGEHRER